MSLRQLKRSLEKLVEIGELRLNWCGGPFGTNLYELPLLHSHLRKMEGASLHVTGCVLNKKKEEEHQLWKSAKPDWLSQQIAALAKEKAM